MLINDTFYVQNLSLLSKHNLTSIYALPKASKIYLTLDQNDVQKNLAVTAEDETYSLTLKVFLIFFLLNGSPKLKLLAHNKSLLSLRKRTKTQVKDRFLFFSQISRYSLKSFFLDSYQGITSCSVVRLQSRLNTITIQKDYAFSNSYQLSYFFKELLPAQIKLIKSKLSLDFVNLNPLKGENANSIYKDATAYLTHIN